MTSLYHLGDPCIHCGVFHDNVNSGPCSKANGLAAQVRTSVYIQGLLDAHQKRAAAETARLGQMLADSNKAIAAIDQGLDMETKLFR